MPHKRNPIGSENVTGIARIIRGYMTPAFENVPLWHERDISHSSAERIMLPDVTILTNYMLNRFKNIIQNLVVFEDNMKANINASYGLVNSQRVMLGLIDKGLSREAAYDLVQPRAMEAWEGKQALQPLIENDAEITKYLSQEDIDDAFDNRHYLQSVDRIFERVGLDE